MATPITWQNVDAPKINTSDMRNMLRSRAAGTAEGSSVPASNVFSGIADALNTATKFYGAETDRIGKNKASRLETEVGNVIRQADDAQSAAKLQELDMRELLRSKLAPNELERFGSYLDPAVDRLNKSADERIDYVQKYEASQQLRQRNEDIAAAQQQLPGLIERHKKLLNSGNYADARTLEAEILNLNNVISGQGAGGAGGSGGRAGGGFLGGGPTADQLEAGSRMEAALTKFNNLEATKDAEGLKAFGKDLASTFGGDKDQLSNFLELAGLNNLGELQTRAASLTQSEQADYTAGAIRAAEKELVDARDNNFEATVTADTDFSMGDNVGFSATAQEYADNLKATYTEDHTQSLQDIHQQATGRLSNGRHDVVVGKGLGKFLSGLEVNSQTGKFNDTNLADSILKARESSASDEEFTQKVNRLINKNISGLSDTYPGALSTTERELLDQFGQAGMTNVISQDEALRLHDSVSKLDPNNLKREKATKEQSLRDARQLVLDNNKEQKLDLSNRVIDQITQRTALFEEQFREKYPSATEAVVQENVKNFNTDLMTPGKRTSDYVEAKMQEETDIYDQEVAEQDATLKSTMESAMQSGPISDDTYRWYAYGTKKDVVKEAKKVIGNLEDSINLEGFDSATNKGMRSAITSTLENGVEVGSKGERYYVSPEMVEIAMLKATEEVRVSDEASGPNVLQDTFLRIIKEDAAKGGLTESQLNSFREQGAAFSAINTDKEKELAKKSARYRAEGLNLFKDMMQIGTNF